MIGTRVVYKCKLSDCMIDHPSPDIGLVVRAGGPGIWFVKWSDGSITPERIPKTDDPTFSIEEVTDYILSETVGDCFMCGAKTNRVDLCYNGYYCGSQECEDQIRIELEMLKEGWDEEDD